MSAPRVLRSQFCRRRWNSIPWGTEAVLNRCLSRSKEVKLPLPLMENSWKKIYSIAPTELPAIFSPFHPMIHINPIWFTFLKKSANTDLISKMLLIGWLPSPLGLSFPLIGWNLFPWDPIFSQVTCQALPGMQIRQILVLDLSWEKTQPFEFMNSENWTWWTLLTECHLRKTACISFHKKNLSNSWIMWCL